MAGGLWLPSRGSLPHGWTSAMCERMLATEGCSGLRPSGTALVSGDDVVRQQSGASIAASEAWRPATSSRPSDAIGGTVPLSGPAGPRISGACASIRPERVSPLAGPGATARECCCRAGWRIVPGAKRSNHVAAVPHGALGPDRRLHLVPRNTGRGLRQACRPLPTEGLNGWAACREGVLIATSRRRLAPALEAPARPLASDGVWVQTACGARGRCRSPQGVAGPRSRALGHDARRHPWTPPRERRR
jgi:hypothetical protein